MIREEHLESIGFKFVKRYEHDEENKFVFKRYVRKNITVEITYKNGHYHLFDFYIDEQYYMANKWSDFKHLIDILDKFKVQ
jgi:hypothetical protein